MKACRSIVTLAIALPLTLILSLKISAQAQSVTFLADFNHTNGDGPSGSVIQATDGNFYGTTSTGGVYGHGNVFRMTPSGEITSIYDFCAQTHCPDGAYPLASPILGSDGNLYGVATYGGSDTRYEEGWGTIYKMTLGGKITILHTFCQAYPCVDGATPRGIIQGADGNFYGTTNIGGANKVGVIFVVTPGGKYKVVHNFCSQGASCPDGGYPVDPPIQGHNGNLYGAATSGGMGGGVLYEFSPAGAYEVIYNFCSSSSGCSDFSAAPTTIVQDAGGNFFGTTFYGGSDSSGTVFELSSTNQYSILYALLYTEGTVNGGLTLANDGNFYSTTANGDGQSGSIYEVTPAGVYTSLYNFVFGDPVSAPYGPIFQGTDGSLYGTAEYGTGVYQFGAVFKISNNLSPLVATAPGAGKVGQTIIILGNGLTGSTSVTFNRIPAKFTVESDTYIKATIPNGATTGIVSVVTSSGTLNSNPQFVVTK